MSNARSRRPESDVRGNPPKIFGLKPVKRLNHPHQIPLVVEIDRDEVGLPAALPLTAPGPFQQESPCVDLAGRLVAGEGC